jgi:hypothetical protein
MNAIIAQTPERSPLRDLRTDHGTKQLPIFSERHDSSVNSGRSAIEKVKFLLRYNSSMAISDVALELDGNTLVF